MNNVRAKVNRKKKQAKLAKGKGKAVATSSPRKMRDDERVPFFGTFYDGIEKLISPNKEAGPKVDGLIEIFAGEPMIWILDQIETVRKMNKEGDNTVATVGVVWKLMKSKFSTWLSSPPQTKKDIEFYEKVSP